MSYNPNSTSQKSALSGSTSGTFSQFASATTTSYSITWPAAQAAGSGYVLSNDGTGVLSWVAQSGGVTSINTLTGSITLAAGSGITITPSSNTLTIASTGGGGSVTSVGLSLPSIFTVSNTPVTTSGTLTATLNTQAANSVFAGPSSGSVAAPTFRALVSADIPSLSSIYLPLAGGTMSGNINMGGQRVQVMSDPSSASDAATKNYVDITTISSTLMTTAGDIIFENATPAPARLPVGSNGQVLTVVSGLPAWSNTSATATTQEFTLAPSDITNKYVTLSSTPVNPTLTLLNVIGGPMQAYTTDFTVSGSQLSWSGLFLDGVLVSGDILIVQFS